jgi:hypothetical protein
MLITELALKYQELFAATVNVRRECGVGRIPDQRRCTRNFIANPIEHHAFDARHR